MGPPGSVYHPCAFLCLRVRPVKAVKRLYTQHVNTHAYTSDNKHNQMKSTYLISSSLMLLSMCISKSTFAASLPEQLSTTKECTRDGFSDTNKYRTTVAVSGTAHFMPLYSSVDLNKQVQVSSLLIFVHGIGGNANTFFCDALKAVPSSVGVVAPYFGNEAVRLKTWAGAAAAADGDPTSLYWDGSKWNSGGGAANAGSVASFAALDAIVAQVAAKNPGLKQIVVAGFSAGAQMVQRYAWATSHGPSFTPPVKFVVSDPSTYLYFDDRRPDPSCTPLKDTGANLRCSKFARPDSATVSSCPNFNTYRLGLDGLSEGSPYFAQARIANDPAAVSAAYLKKSILYIFGSADTCNCNTANYANPAACIRTDGASSCRPSVAGPTCCDMPDGKVTNSFVDVNCGDMLQVCLPVG